MPPPLVVTWQKLRGAPAAARISIRGRTSLSTSLNYTDTKYDGNEGAARGASKGRGGQGGRRSSQYLIEVLLELDKIVPVRNLLQAPTKIRHPVSSPSPATTPMESTAATATICPAPATVSTTSSVAPATTEAATTATVICLRRKPSVTTLYAGSTYFVSRLSLSSGFFTSQIEVTDACRRGARKVATARQV